MPIYNFPETKNQKDPKKPKKSQKKPKKPMPNLRFKGSVLFFWDCYPQKTKEKFGATDGKQIAALKLGVEALERKQRRSLVRVLLGSEVEETDGACYRTCVGDTGKGETE
jgi:hypothetical protein